MGLDSQRLEAAEEALDDGGRHQAHEVQPKDSGHSYEDNSDDLLHFSSVLLRLTSRPQVTHRAEIIPSLSVSVSVNLMPPQRLQRKGFICFT
jgi:hypothetical protein